MEFTPVFLAVADNSTYNLIENQFSCDTPFFATPLTSCEESLLFIPPIRSTKVSSILVSQVDPEALYYVSLLFFGFLLSSFIITGIMFLVEHYKQFQLQKELLSRSYYAGIPLKDVCSPNKVQCCIMLDDQFKFDCIQCPEGHWVGRDALQNHIKFEAQKPLNVTDGKIKCPLCEHRYDDQSLAFFCGPEAFQAYQKMRGAKIHQEEKATVLAEIEEGARRKEREAERALIQEAVRNQFTAGDGTYTGYLCPTCGFGPVDHMECDDLAAHHGEFRDFGIEIDNSCPMCMWHGTNKTQWGKWQGEFLEGEQLEATQKAVDEFKIPFEEFKGEALIRLQELKTLLLHAQVSRRFALLQEIAGPREFPETACAFENPEDPEEIMFQIRCTWNNSRRAMLATDLKRTMESFKTSSFKSEYKYKTLKKEQTDLVEELNDRRQKMKDNIQTAVKALGYTIEVEHPPPESDEEDF